jgi:hypothetical protein
MKIVSTAKEIQAELAGGRLQDVAQVCSLYIEAVSCESRMFYLKID